MQEYLALVLLGITLTAVIALGFLVRSLSDRLDMHWAAIGEQRRDINEVDARADDIFDVVDGMRGVTGSQGQTILQLSQSAARHANRLDILDEALNTTNDTINTALSSIGRICTRLDDMDGTSAAREKTLTQHALALMGIKDRIAEAEGATERQGAMLGQAWDEISSCKSRLEAHGARHDAQDVRFHALDQARVGSLDRLEKLDRKVSGIAKSLDDKIEGLSIQLAGILPVGENVHALDTTVAMLHGKVEAVLAAHDLQDWELSGIQDQFAQHAEAIKALGVNAEASARTAAGRAEALQAAIDKKSVELRSLSDDVTTLADSFKSQRDAWNADAAQITETLQKIEVPNIDVLDAAVRQHEDTVLRLVERLGRVEKISETVIGLEHEIAQVGERANEIANNIAPRVDSIASDIQALQHDAGEFARAIQSHGERIDGIEVSLNGCIGEQGRLSPMMHDLSKGLSNLQDRMDDISQTVDELDGDLGHVEEAHAELDTRMTKMAADVSAIGTELRSSSQDLLEQIGKVPDLSCYEADREALKVVAVRSAASADAIETLLHRIDAIEKVPLVMQETDEHAAMLAELRLGIGNTVSRVQALEQDAAQLRQFIDGTNKAASEGLAALGGICQQLGIQLGQQVDRLAHLVAQAQAGVVELRSKPADISAARALFTPVIGSIRSWAEDVQRALVDAKVLVVEPRPIIEVQE